MCEFNPELNPELNPLDCPGTTTDDRRPTNDDRLASSRAAENSQRY